MPSNVRRFDKSCQEVCKKNTTVYKCWTCDPTKLLNICEKCFRDGKHYGHEYKTIKSDSGFCNCGDLSGLVYCLNHEKVVLPDISKPLHVNDRGLKEFSLLSGIASNDVQILAQLNQIRKLSVQSSDGKLIKKYLDNSQSQGQKNLKIKKSYSVYRKDHENRFVANGYNKQRRLLLWHGTKRTNLNGILMNGFKLPNSGGLMFGNGVYFADRVTKSSNYCDQTGASFLLLCEVALGSIYRTGLPKQYTSAPPNYHSIKGVGRNIPDSTGQIKFDGDIVVPLGKTIENKHPKIQFSSLAHNEFIVFNADRILVKFIVQFDWG